MALSTGTLNLKFMQRAAVAAARAAKSEPAARPSTSVSAAASTTGSPLPASPAPPAPATPAPESATAVPDDDAAAKWVLPRHSNAEAGPSTRPRVQFVASYMPFLEDEDSNTGMSPGRLSFGIVSAEPAETQAGGDDDDGDFDMSDSDDEVAVLRKDKGKGRAETKVCPRPPSAQPSQIWTDAKGLSAPTRYADGGLARTVSRADEPTPEPEEVPATFQRPRGFSPSRERPTKGKDGGKKGKMPASPAPPVAQKGKAKQGKHDSGAQSPASSSTSKSSKKDKKETKDKDKKSALSSNLYSRLKDKLNISGSSRENSASPLSDASTLSASKKRGRSESESGGGGAKATNAANAKRPKVGSDGLGGTLDEREKNKKAAKKKEKRKNEQRLAGSGSK